MRRRACDGSMRGGNEGAGMRSGNEDLKRWGGDERAG
jgi:hypothetical protein